MITFPIDVFLDKIKETQNTKRRSIRFLLKKEHLIKGAQIEEILIKLMLSADDVDKCVFCGWLRRIGEVVIHIEENVVKFEVKSYHTESRICFDGINKNCPKHSMNKKSKEYMIKVYGQEVATNKLSEMSNVGKGRYTKQWFIEKYGENDGLIKYKERSIKLSKMSTKEGFLEKYGKEEGTKRWDSFISKQCVREDRQYYIDKHGKEEGTKIFEKYDKYRQGMNNFDYLIERYGEERAQEIIDSRKCTKSNFIKKYGKEEGIRKYEDYNQRKTITLENLIKRHGKTIGKEKWDKFRDSSKQTLENMIDRYGEEEGPKKYKEYLDKLKGKCTLGWFIDKYGEVEGPIKHSEFCEKSKYNLEVSIRKYGEEEGTKRYLEFVKNISKFRKGYSLISQELFNKIRSTIKRDTFNFATLNFEYVLVKLDTYYCLDFFDTHTNRCIEFNGDFWHANHIKFFSDDVVHNNLTAKDIWQNDKDRLEYIKFRGIDVLIIWEQDYIANPEQILKQCIEFLERE